MRFNRKSLSKVSDKLPFNLCKDLREEVYGVFLQSEMITQKKELRISALRKEALERHQTYLKVKEILTQHY